MACRIPSGASSPNAKRVEFRCADPSCNAYLAFAAMLMAGIDGFDNRYDPGQPIDKNLYDLPPDELARIPCAPGSLEEALDALEADNAFLLKGDVFTPDLIETYLSYKRTAKRMRCVCACIHTNSFLYYDIWPLLFLFCPEVGSRTGVY
jgi:glutamine synthetase